MPFICRTGLFAITVAFAISCAHSGVGRTDGDASARAGIKKGNDSFIAALKRRDAAAISQVFTEDGEVIPFAEKGFIAGRAAIEAFNVERLKKFRSIDLVLTTLTVGTSGDLAYETGTSRATLQEGDKAPITRTGRYVVVWRHDPDGVWRIRVDLPIPDPAP